MERRFVSLVFLFNPPTLSLVFIVSQIHEMIYSFLLLFFFCSCCKHIAHIVIACCLCLCLFEMSNCTILFLGHCSINCLLHYAFLYCFWLAILFKLIWFGCSFVSVFGSLAYCAKEHLFYSTNIYFFPFERRILVFWILEQILILFFCEYQRCQLVNTFICQVTWRVMCRLRLSKVFISISSRTRNNNRNHKLDQEGTQTITVSTVIHRTRNNKT